MTKRKVFVVPVRVHVFAETNVQAVDLLWNAGIGDNGPVTLTDTDGNRIEVLYINVPAEVGDFGGTPEFADYTVDPDVTP